MPSCSPAAAPDKLEETASEGTRRRQEPGPSRPTSAIPYRSRRCSRKTKEAFGRLDVLFNNAGIGAPPVPMEDLPLETWKKVVDTNLTGMFLCTQEAIKIMKAQDPRGGRIINNGSISAHTPRPRVGRLYRDQARGDRPHQADRARLPRRRHRCSQIDIGNAATPLTERMVQGQGVLQADGSMTVEARMNADDVGRAVVYIANLPLDTNVLFMTVMANLMPFVGRG